TPQQLKLTTEGMMVGTPFAIAPEVLRGADGDERGDLWALGVLLYEMVTGVLPFQGHTPVELGSSILHDPLPALPARVPAGIRTIIQRCLAKEPGQRYQRASEVRAALETVESGESSRPGAIEPSPRDARPRVPRRVWQVAAGIGVLALALGAIMIARGVPGMGTPRVRSLAVLPLENLSGDPEQEYFVDGTTEALITQLAQIQALRVASRTSVMAYKGTRKSLPEIARELDVDAIVEGSVTRSGSRVRITAQLIHAPSDRHLWAQSYERELSNVLALQDEVTRDIAERIRLQLTPEERERLDRRQLVNPAVYDLYLKGRHQQNQLNEASVHKAIELYRQASELDPKDARPYSGLADAYAVLTQIIGTVPPEEGWPKVREYARRALALDESLADAHVSMGAVLWLADWDWDGAEREFRRALQLNPSYSLGRSVLGILLISVGRPEEGVGELRRALEQDSLSLFTSVNAEWGFYYARHYDEALRQGRRLLEIAPEFAAAHGAMRHVALARGQFATAIGHEAQTFPPPMRAAAETRLRAAFVAGGPRGYWEAEREASLARGFDRYWPSWLAAVEGQLGNHDAAIQWLDRALTVKDGNLAFLLVDASMDPLRRDPRFAAVLSRLRLAPPS
ncbi:MAG TPA: protein kinase, partial [Candidatus Limnocylindria bacterium]|nr:protein kinase [Candidatus Limnocylindria bacterium]